MGEKINKLKKLTKRASIFFCFFAHMTTRRMDSHQRKKSPLANFFYAHDCNKIPSQVFRSDGW